MVVVVVVLSGTLVCVLMKHTELGRNFVHIYTSLIPRRGSVLVCVYRKGCV